MELMYPLSCAGCEEELAIDTSIFCISCQSKISHTDHFETKDNDLIYRMGPRVNTLHAAALYNFIKAGRVRHAVLSLKYKKRAEIGLMLGREYGEKMSASELFLKPDYLVPIPVHKKRLKKRGYNQSELITKGISEVTGIVVRTDILIKNIEISSQTKKNREDRFENVLNSFGHSG